MIFGFGKQLNKKNDYPTFPNPAGIGSGMGYESTRMASGPQTPASAPAQLPQSPMVAPEGLDAGRMGQAPQSPWESLG